MFMEHEWGLFLFAEQTSVLQTIVPMCMIIIGILVCVPSAVAIFACSKWAVKHGSYRALYSSGNVEISSSMALPGPSKPIACSTGYGPTFPDYLPS